MSARILVVDDMPLNVKLLLEWLEHEHFAVSTAADGLEALAKIAAEQPDIVLLDVMMPGLDGFETCRRIKADQEMAHIPVVIVTALDDVDDLVKGFEAGADDFLIRPINGLELIARVRSQLQRKQQYERVLEEALIDPLTAAFNRRYFNAHAPRLAARCGAARRPIAILMVDLDDLKRINDTHGHAAGDRVLKTVVDRVMSAVRPSDLVARMGGDEFAVVMPETDLGAAIQVGERLCSRVANVPIDGIGVTVSIGAAASKPAEEEEFDAMLQQADAALYKAKRAGGNRVRAIAAEQRLADTPRSRVGRFIRRLWR
jgi:diguanylate cyclase (GGDEF)-like protein